MHSVPSSAFYHEPFYASTSNVDVSMNSRMGRDTFGQQPSYQWHRNEGVSSIRPSMDLHEDEDKNIVTATFEMPGVEQGDIQLKVQNDKLTVSAEPRLSLEHAEIDFSVRERRIGKFFRILMLPPGVNESHIIYSIEDGILMITFPKAITQMPIKAFAAT